MFATMRFTLIALALGLCLQAGCGGGNGKKEPAPGFDGTWAVCRNDGFADFRESFSIAGTVMVLEIIDHPATSDRTCDGDGTSEGTVAATVAFGATTPVPYGGRTVNATQADLTIGSEAFYSLAYRDVAASPDVLLLGDDSGALDGSTPALRPTTLQDLPRSLQSAPRADDLTGTWKLCPASGGEVLTLDGTTGAFHLTKYAGTCGVGTITEEVTGTFTLEFPVYVGFGAVTVTGFAANLAVTGGGTLYTTFYVDREASPHRFFHGDDTVHGMDGSSPSLRPRVLFGDVYLKQ